MQQSPRVFIYTNHYEAEIFPYPPISETLSTKRSNNCLQNYLQTNKTLLENVNNNTLEENMFIGNIISWMQTMQKCCRYQKALLAHCLPIQNVCLQKLNKTKKNFKTAVLLGKCVNASLAPMHSGTETFEEC